MAHRRIRDAINVYINDYLSYLDEDQEITNIYAMVHREMEIAILEKALQVNYYHQSNTAKWLGISRNTLKKKIEEYHIEMP